MLRVLVFLVGAWLVVETVLSAVRTFVLPRSDNVPLTRLVFLTMRRLFDLRLRWTRTYVQRDRILALYAPVTLLVLPVTWLALVMAGYTAMFWASGVEPLGSAFKLSGSSLFTLGFASVEDVPRALLVFSEATIGLGLLALLLAYLPTMYGAFSRRETAVNLLEVRAGSPPWCVTMIERFHRLHRLEKLGELWVSWELWFAELEESHTSLAALSFFRSPQPYRSWVTAAGTVLDTAALTISALDVPHDVQADLCIRAGFLALRRIADFFRIAYPPDPHYPANGISVTRAEFDAAWDRLAAEGVPMKPDRDLAWSDFAGWRVNYDAVLLALCRLTMAPDAPWSSDRAWNGGAGRPQSDSSA